MATNSNENHDEVVDPPVTPEAEAPPTNDPPDPKEPPAKRPHSPDRENKLLKTDREGIGGPSTDEGKAISAMNNAKHGLYARGPFHLMPWEDADEYDAMAARLRKQYPPVNEITAQILSLLIQAFWRFGRCDRAEMLAEMGDVKNADQFRRGIYGASSHRARCDKSYYTHQKQLERLLADHKKEQKQLLEEMKSEELEQIEEESKPEPRFNEEGEEMDSTYPRLKFYKISCLPESQCNEVLEFDRTLSGRVTVKRIPMRDWEGGRLLHPSVKPRNMKGDWPDYALGPYKDYYKNLKEEEKQDS